MKLKSKFIDFKYFPKISISNFDFKIYPTYTTGLPRGMSKPWVPSGPRNIFVGDTFEGDMLFVGDIVFVADIGDPAWSCIMKPKHAFSY